VSPGVGPSGDEGVAVAGGLGVSDAEGLAVAEGDAVADGVAVGLGVATCITNSLVTVAEQIVSAPPPFDEPLH
jgi:hypothetical protein